VDKLLEEDEYQIERCEYCGKKENLVQSVHTGQWFCNDMVENAGSHIMIHLIKNMETEVRFHETNKIKFQVECILCGGKNIFNLGFLSAGNSIVILICKDPCSFELESN